MSGEAYDSGNLTYYRGGTVEWWHEYIRAELGCSHDFYTSIIEQIETQLAQSEQKRKVLREALEFYAKDDSTSVEMGILEDVSLRPASAALKADEED